MTVTTPPRPPRTKEAELEALIEEARRRARRRRLLHAMSALAAVVAAAAAVGAYYLVRSEGSSPTAGVHSQATRGSGGGELLLYGLLEHLDLGGVIYGIRPDGTDLRRLTRTSSDDFAPSPDGKRIVFTRGRGSFDRRKRYSALFVLDIASGRARRMTPWRASGTYRQPRWALGGRRILYANCRPFFSECAIWSVRPDGSAARNLTRGVKSKGFPIVSPDGQRFAFESYCPGWRPCPRILYMERIDGSHRRVLARDVFNGPLSWSTRGLIAFARYADDLEAISLSGQRRHYVELPGAAFPTWSPKGTQLAFERSRSGIYVVRSNGTGLRRLNRSLRSSWFGAWSPDGRRIAYTEHRIHGHRSIVVVDAHDGHVESVIPFKQPTWVVAWRP